MHESQHYLLHVHQGFHQESRYQVVILQKSF